MVESLLLLVSLLFHQVDNMWCMVAVVTLEAAQEKHKSEPRFHFSRENTDLLFVLVRLGSFLLLAFVSKLR